MIRKRRRKKKQMEDECETEIETGVTPGKPGQNQQIIMPVVMATCHQLTPVDTSLEPLIVSFTTAVACSTWRSFIVSLLTDNYSLMGS